ncbi:C40 family peptidase [Rudaeicoccus suwonensis]|uniref:Cell wall-associated NlpC family hydrolase n=1 Tax=Rudaeicoccus suwonensis TaxID=657409 RepID=A0A561EBU4_9MICO|nr:C40 family peptidase [Rudaeicoccus suwonensis]TWE13077.1 cell wall-associated NlpC family hydrolase [Rudaeicoccus suwonensis]
MVRKVLIGLVVAVVFLGPGIGLTALAGMFDPATTDAATCATTTDAGGLSGPSMPVSGTVPQSLTATTADGQTVTLDHTQLVRAATIIAVGNSENIPANGQVIALMAALTESTLRVLANTTVYPQSANYPNDGDGDNDASLGLFQMQPPDGWGTVAELMDPVWSSRAFYGGPDGPNHGSPAGLLDIPNWQSLSLGAAAQAVEVSQYPTRYANYQPVAEKIASTLTGVTLTGSQCITGTTGNLPPGFAGAFIAAAEKEIGLPYVWGGGTYTGPSGEAADGQPGFDCSGLVMYAAYQASNGKVRLLHYTGDQINETQPVTWADKQPGDIIFYTYPGASVPHHVVIYLGGDRILQAPETGQNVGYGTLSMFTGQTATVRRIAEPSS